MNTIYTSYFGNHRNFPKNLEPISIARYAPKGFKGKQYLNLAPSRELLKQFKQGLITEHQYTDRYTNETLSKLNPIIVGEELKGHILLCYEKTGDFCHRHIVVNWLQKENFKIKEIPNGI